MIEPTRSEVLTHIVEMKGDIGLLTGKMDTIIEVHEDRIKTTEADVRSLKTWRNYIVGGATTIAALFGVSLK